jgi:Reverse transcriptase (RNA-dependent DNA polymerase)
LDDRATILHLSCVFSRESVQVDVKTAFLNGELDEEMYVRTPRGIAGWPSRTKRLLKAMYELKQAHKAWYSKCFGDLVRMGFSEFKSVSCGFIEWFGTSIFVLVQVYVDDFLMLSPSVHSTMGLNDDMSSNEDHFHPPPPSAQRTPRF